VAFCYAYGMSATGIVEAADNRLVIDRFQQVVLADGHEIDTLTPIQHKIIGSLATRLDVVHPKADICEDVWQRTGPRIESNLKTQVKRIRQQLGTELGNPKQGALRSRYAVGYYLVRTLAETDIPPAETYTVSSGFITVDPLNMTVRVADEITSRLSVIEFNLFDMMASQPGMTISHNELYLKAWNKNSLLGMESLKVAINKLRKKLGPVYGDHKKGIIRNDFNKGYYLLDKDAD
jgi:DNA-binding response OmpR family regulator